MTAVGDLDRDGRNDLVARHKGTPRRAARHRPKGGFKRDVLRQGHAASYDQFIGAGDRTATAAADLLRPRRQGLLLLCAARATAASAPDRRGRVVGRRTTGSPAAATSTATAAPTWSPAPAKGKVCILPPRRRHVRRRRSGRPPTCESLRLVTGAGNLVGDAAPDLVGVGQQPGGHPQQRHLRPRRPDRHRRHLRRADLLLNAGDWDRDGVGDVITRDTDGQPAALPRQRRGPARPGRRARRRASAAIAGLAAGRRHDRRRLPRPDGHAGRRRADGLPGHRHRGSRRAPVAGRPAVARAGLPSRPVGASTGCRRQRHPGQGPRRLRRAPGRAPAYVYLYTGTKRRGRRPRFLGRGMGAYDLAG